MKKLCLASLLLTSACLSYLPSPQSVQAATLQQVQVIKSVSFREQPSTSATRIRYAQPGEKLTILDKPNSYWLHVRDEKGKTGYVSSLEQYVRIVNVTTPTTPTVTTNAKIVKSVSFRKGPSVNEERMRYLQAGESVNITEKTNDYWYKIIDKNGVTGYVSTSSEYITVTGTIPKPPAPPVVDRNAQIEKVIAAGMKYLGTPYEYGSSREDTTTFDCSDFTRQAFLDGIQLKLPGDSRSQGAMVKELGKTSTDWHNLKRGDLMFFMSYEGSRASDYAGIDKSTATINHVGIYLGDGTMLNTRSVVSGGVRIDKIEGTYWEYRFLYGGSAF